MMRLGVEQPPQFVGGKGSLFDVPEVSAVVLFATSSNCDPPALLWAGPIDPANSRFVIDLQAVQVLHVLGVGRNAQVVRSNAERVVAKVIYNATLTDRSNVQLIREAMGADGSPLELEGAIADSVL